MVHVSNSPEQHGSEGPSPKLPESTNGDLSIVDDEEEEHIDRDQVVPSPSSPSHKKHPHVCFCGKSFAYLSILESHMRSHTGERPFQCAYCEKRFAQKATLQVHERTHTGERPYKCKYCDKTFAQYGTKTVHEKSAHLGIRNYKCPLCTKCLSSPSALYTHKKTHGEKTFECGYCDKTFTLKNYLKLHVKQVHEQTERKHVCNYCSKSFAYAGSLQVHIRTHTGERPYKCKYCPKAFASQGNLQSHERTHTGERPYGCKQCGRTFIQKSQLTAHEATHTYLPGGSSHSGTESPAKKQNEYVCKYCGKRYAYASSLYVHTRLHTGERPFKCRFCEKAFTNQGNMQVHERVHTGERPYKCPSCDKSYAQKVGLKIHLEQCQQYLDAKNPSPGVIVDNTDIGCEPVEGEHQTHREQKKRRLEDLLPKLFNGRLKSRPAKATRLTPYSTSLTPENRSVQSVSPPGGGLKLPTIPASIAYSPPLMVSGAHHIMTTLPAAATLPQAMAVTSLINQQPAPAGSPLIGQLPPVTLQQQLFIQQQQQQQLDLQQLLIAEHMRRLLAGQQLSIPMLSQLQQDGGFGQQPSLFGRISSLHLPLMNANGLNGGFVPPSIKSELSPVNGGSGALVA
uniref:C2H2-type domain-containing protein n=1 Tax=Plectus sambesii TaxID=2011161 RepID=A0A914WBJ0_9BILA